MKKYLIIIIWFCLLQSCSDETENSIKITGFLPLSIGNYWVYQSKGCDKNEIEINGTDAIDSLVVVSQERFGDGDLYYLYWYRNDLLIDTIKILQEGNYEYLLGIPSDTVPNIKFNDKVTFIDAKMPSHISAFYFEKDSSYDYMGSMKNGKREIVINTYVSQPYEYKCLDSIYRIREYEFRRDIRDKLTHFHDTTIWARIYYEDSTFKDTLVNVVEKIGVITNNFKITNYYINDDIGILYFYEHAFNKSSSIERVVSNLSFYSYTVFGRKYKLIRYQKK